MTTKLSKDCESKVDEQLLVAQAQQGDKVAFQQLYLRHQGRVYALCYRLSGQSQLAEEIAQDCFVRLWQKLPLFRGDSQFTTWMHALVVRQALNSVKQHKSFWARFLPIEASQAQSSGKEHNYDGLDKLIVRLPERARIIFVLHAIEGYQHNEIAKLLNLAPGTSKAQYHRARNLLKEMLS